MESDNGGLNFRVTLDNSQLAADAARVKAEFRNIGNTGIAEGSRIENAFNRMTTAAAAYLSINFAARIGKEIINVRGEFQQLGIAFETMLGSKERADKLMSEAVTFAAKTPFTLQDVATNIKQLMAMGVASESVMGTMKALGDVAAGVSVPISRIAVNYGQVMTLGTLQGRELRDFAMAGIPLIDELAKNLGKAKNEIQDMVTAGQIGAPDVTKAFQTMSAEGGKFFNLMEKQNASVTGQISNLTDRLQVAANEIGKSNEGLIYSGISGLSSIVANYKEIGETLIWLAGIYGGYKTAVMLISAVKAAEIAATTAKKAALAEQFAMEKASTAAEIAKAGKETAIASEMIRIESLKSASTAKTIAAKEAAALANEHLIASEKAYKATMMESSLASTYQQTQENQVKLKKELAEIEKSRIIASKANAKVSAAITSETILNANLEAAAIKKAKGEEILVTQAGILVKQEEALVTTVATGAEIRALQSKKALAAAQQLLNATMLNNPYVLGAVALGAIAYGTYKYITYQTELEKATSKMNVEIADEKGKILDLFTALKLTTEGTKEHEAAKKKLINTYGENISEQNKELISLGQVKNAYDEVTKAITDNIAARTRDELVGTIRTEYNTDSQKGKKNLINQFDGQAKSTVAFTINDLIDKFTIDKLSASDVEKQWKEFYQKLSDIDKNAMTGLKARKIQGYFYDALLPIGEMNDKLKEVDDSYSKFISDSNKGQKSPEIPDLKNYNEQRAELQKQLVIEKKKLDDLKLSNFDKLADAKRKEISDLEKDLAATSGKALQDELSSKLSKAKAELAKINEQGLDPVKAVSDQEAAIKALEDRLGISKKQKEAVDEIKAANEALEKAVKSGDQAAMSAAAKKITALEAEKKKLDEIIALEMQRAWRTQFDGQPMTQIQTIGTKPIQQVGQVRMFGGVMQELTEIDKKGEAVWKNRKADTAELAKFAKEKYKDAADLQKKLDEEVAQKKKETQQQILDGATQFTNELIEQLNLSEQQSKQLKESVSMISSAASGNWIGAIFQAASMVLGTLKKETVSFLDITNEQISKTNDLLSLHSKILAGLSGNDYYKASAEELKKINLELDSYNKKLSEILVVDVRTHRKIDTSEWDSAAWLKALDNPIFGINGGSEATAAILAQIADLEAKKASLINEMYQTILGFGSSEVSDSIFKGIEDGLKLGENSLGGFAQSFGDLMKKALMQAIIDSTNTEITSNFLPKVKEFLQNDEVGPNGEKISPREQLILEGIYSSIVKGAQEQEAATKPITDKYGTSTDTRIGSTKGIAQANQDSVDELNGRFTAIQGHTFSMNQGVGILVGNSNLILKSVQGIEKNTDRLEAIENNIASVKSGIDTMNYKFEWTGIKVK